MSIRKLRDAKFTNKDLATISELIDSGIMKNTEILDDNEIVIKPGRVTAHLYHYRDMDSSLRPTMMRTEVLCCDGGSRVPFGCAWDIPDVNVVAKIMHFYKAVVLYSMALDEEYAL